MIVAEMRSPSSPKSWVMPTFRPRIPGISEADLDVDAGRQVVQTLEGVDRLRARLMDVDQALVRPDLEVLARILVLERAPDHDVDVLLGRQGHGPRDGRAGALGGLHDLCR